MSWTTFSWRRLFGALLACCMTVLAALAMPVRVPEEGAVAPSSELLPGDLVELEREDLGAFFEIRRWSVLPETSPDLPAPPAAPERQPALSVNPVLLEMGYVGLISARGRHAVLLALPGGKVVRMLPGDTLPDGRILVSVTDNSLTLRAEGRAEEVLTLFPRAKPGARARDGDGSSVRRAVDGGAAPRVSNHGFGASQ